MAKLLSPNGTTHVLAAAGGDEVDVINYFSRGEQIKGSGGRKLLPLS